MYSKKVTIVNPTGLHARPAAEFCKNAGQYASAIQIKRLTGEEKETNAKSVIGVMAMALSKGVEVEITAEGSDENKAVDTLTGLIESGFGEL
ncbi:MAG: HPr family phosphocarrier protein [Eubacteriaceae bacterium]|jgi:phosphocarrier protein HPr|nr:HPr family phosphocarrier protein [Eubacteriaceae bacterium]